MPSYIHNTLKSYIGYIFTVFTKDMHIFSFPILPHALSDAY